MNRSLFEIMGRTSGARWGKGTVVTYAKFYVNPPGSQPLPHQRRQATVRPSLSKALRGATISRRYAAGRCADAQNAPRKRGDRTAPYGEHAFLVGIGRDSELIGDHRAD